jgi:hypothetical protein
MNSSADRETTTVAAEYSSADTRTTTALVDNSSVATGTTSPSTGNFCFYRNNYTICKNSSAMKGPLSLLLLQEQAILA